MTIVEAHIILGINVTETIDTIAERYCDYLKVNPDTTYIDWLEQEVVLHVISGRLNITKEELLNTLGITREQLVTKYNKKDNDDKIYTKTNEIKRENEVVKEVYR